MTDRKRLGRGLDALIPTAEKKQEAGVRELPLVRIVPNPRQPRQQHDRASLEELAASIATHGVVQPVIVTEVPGSIPPSFQLVAGERRWRAAQLAGLVTIPALVKELSPRQVLELALVENLQRADLNALEEAEAYQMLADEFGLSHDEIARQVGKSRPAVTNTLRLLQLAPAVREKVFSGELSAGHARALLALPSAGLQVQAMRLVLERGLSVRQTEELVKRLPQEVQRQAHSGPPPEIAEIESRLRDSLGTKVSLARGKKGGKVTIYFYSDEEMEALMKRLGVE